MDDERPISDQEREHADACRLAYRRALRQALDAGVPPGRALEGLLTFAGLAIAEIGGPRLAARKARAVADGFDRAADQEEAEALAEAEPMGRA